MSNLTRLAAIPSFLSLGKHKLNVIGLVIGLVIVFVSAWQLDIVAASTIAQFYDIVKDWKLWMPAIPPFGWQATYWSFPDAYTRFFILMFVGFAISLVSLWFWED